MRSIRCLLVQMSGFRLRLFGVYGVLMIANLLSWVWAIVLFHDRPVLLGTALLVYGLGLRHAVDADHIAAIDNVVRKLMRGGGRPVAVGFFFALGHSLVVVVGVALAGAATTLVGPVQMVSSAGGVASAAISIGFLFVVAASNFVVLRGAWRAWRQWRRDGACAPQDVDDMMTNGGILVRLFRPLFGVVTKSWHMAPLGFLFGLGFETATEVALLGVSATQVAQGISLASIMVFPALFASGMCLVDTTDGVVMLGVYEWAIRMPVRKLYYNLTLTSISVLAAVTIASLEALGLASDQFGFEGGIWSLVSWLNENFNTLGFLIVGAFAAAWAVSFAVYRLSGRERTPALVFVKATVRPVRRGAGL